MSRLLEFYRGEGRDVRGRSLAEVLAFPDDRWESVHDFIQWIFPLREPSGFNPDAPLLAEADVEAFRAEPELKGNLLRSLDRFLAFLGLVREGDRVVEGPNFRARRDVWDGPNHNWLRITRVLHSLRVLGLVDEAEDLFAYLEDAYRGGQSAITADTFRYWEGAVRPASGSSRGGRR